MVKKNNKIKDDEIYQIEQVHKKHRGKSDKIAKRIEKKRNKKKVKSHRFEKRTLAKYLIKTFKQHKKIIDIHRLPFDFDEIELIIKKIISHKDKESINRILQNFDKMEKTPKEVNLSSFENKGIIKDLCKLMKTLHVKQNPKNPMKYSLYHMFKKRDAKVRYTTNIEEIIPECLGSYYLLVKSLFEYYSKEERDKKEKEEEKEEEEKEEEEFKKENENDLDKERFVLDAEYEVIESEIGRNAELINKAFNMIINDNGEKKRIELEEKDKILQKRNDTNLNNIPEESEECNTKNVSGADFLKMTLGLLNN